MDEVDNPVGGFDQDVRCAVLFVDAGPDKASGDPSFKTDISLMNGQTPVREELTIQDGNV